MECKNCNVEIFDNDNFCSACGAKIVKERLTLKNLFSSFINALGWDNKFFLTLRHLLHQPHKVSSDFINGVRNKYANPFSFLIINLTISLLVYTQFYDSYIELSSDIGLYYTEQHDNNVYSNEQTQKGLELLGYNNQKDLQRDINSALLKYYNTVSFILLPFYTLLAFLVFGKPFNFGEHLIINTYLQGILTFLSVVLFLLSLWTKINFVLYGIPPLLFIYYIFTYQKIYKFNPGRFILKIFKFIGLLMAFLLLILILSYIIGFLFGYISAQLKQ